MTFVHTLPISKELHFVTDTIEQMSGKKDNIPIGVSVMLRKDTKKNYQCSPFFLLYVNCIRVHPVNYRKQNTD